MRKRLFDLPFVSTNWTQALLWPHLPLWSQYHNVCELNYVQACVHSGINVKKSLQLSERGGSYHPILQMEKWKFSMMTKLTQSQHLPPWPLTSTSPQMSIPWKRLSVNESEGKLMIQAFLLLSRHQTCPETCQSYILHTSGRLGVGVPSGSLFQLSPVN